MSDAEIKPTGQAKTKSVGKEVTKPAGQPETKPVDKAEVKPAGKTESRQAGKHHLVLYYSPTDAFQLQNFLLFFQLNFHAKLGRFDDRIGLLDQPREFVP